MAKWWKIDPDIVGGWSMPDFTDRQEFMFVMNELQKPPVDADGLDRSEEEWKGRQ